MQKTDTKHGHLNAYKNQTVKKFLLQQAVHLQGVLTVQNNL
jgi:hypothetical protein